MTSTGPQEHERDWDAEFAEIADRLGGLSSDDVDAPSRTSANRTHFDAPDAPLVDRFEVPVESSQEERPATDVVSSRAASSHGVVQQPAEPLVVAPAHTAPEPENDDPGPAFVPAPPRPLEADDPATVIMIGALIGGPLWLVVLTVFDREAGAFWWMLAGLTVVLGLGLAIARQPRSRDEDDDDDGARV